MDRHRPALTGERQPGELPPRWYGGPVGSHETDDRRAERGAASRTEAALDDQPVTGAATAGGWRHEHTDRPVIAPGDASDAGHASARRGVSGAGADGRRGLGLNASAGEVARAAGAAFLGRDLLVARPRGWPFGTAARARRERTAAVRAEAQRRRGQFETAFAATFATGIRRPRGVAGRWAPVERERHRRVIAGLVALVVAVFVLAGWLSSATVTPAPAGPPQAGPVTNPASEPGAGSASTPTSTPGSTPGPTTGFAPTLAPIPAAGVAAVAAPEEARIDPATVVLRDPPSGDVTAAELGSAPAAVAAWLARLCPYDYRQPFGAAEQRARSAMTPTGWAQLNPDGSSGGGDRARQSWVRISAARETARCSAATAVVSPEAPRSDATAIVLGSVQRVLADGAGPAWVDTLTVTRVVVRGQDGLWRVDTATTGG